MKYFAGIDIGSTTIKVVLVTETGEMVDHLVTPTGSRFNKNSREAFLRLLERQQLTREDVAYVVSTGYGRKLFKESDETVNEITANAIGVRSYNGQLGVVRTIINVGGQDTKVIALDDQGNVKNFVMNDKCAAGTGRFLEMASRNLEVDIDEFPELHFEAADAPLAINSTCAVFAESEIISLLAAGHQHNEIVAGIHYSIARRIARLAARIGIQDAVMFDGGADWNKGLVAALEDELMRPIVVPENPQITTALGAALMAREIYLGE